MTYRELSSSDVTLEVILEFPTARCSEEPPIIPQSIITKNFILMAKFVIHARTRPAASTSIIQPSRS